MRHIRNKFGDIIYCIRDDGTITDKFDCDVIGHLKGDRITDKFDIDTLYRIRPDGTITDKYDCDVIGHIRDDGSITDKYDIDKKGSVDGYNSSGSSSDSGCLGAVFALLWGIISFLFVVVIPFYFVYMLAPSYLGFSWVGLLCAVLSILFVSTGIVPLAIPFILVFSIIEILFGIYWVLVIIIKIKTRCTRMDVLKLFGKWFLKGPFAFVDVANIMSENNIMPRIARLLNKVFDRVRKTSK